MQRWVKILAIFLLGAGTSLFLNASLLQRNIPSSIKTPEVSKEATSTAVINGAFETTTVKRVIDGDTIELIDGRRVRYIGINTPETVDPRKPVECFGKEASQENKRLVDGKTIRLERDISQTDKYGRLLRYVYVGPPAGGLMVNEQLVREGFARSSTFAPDVAHQEKLRQAEQEARNNNRGLWGGCTLNTTNTTNTTNPTNAIQKTPSGSCVIKGNISTTGDKIYHTPGCGSYDKTVIDESTGERWFCTEEEAVAAGWRKAKNC
ncbi:thermonuclease family protein [Candidatus Gottesmanbacteria bacterium]|nr:thermonuclease family protein [Candidatus Gottesmanbacteria bacterium]